LGICVQLSESWGVFSEVCGAIRRVFGGFVFFLHFSALSKNLAPLDRGGRGRAEQPRSGAARRAKNFRAGLQATGPSAPEYFCAYFVTELRTSLAENLQSVLVARLTTFAAFRRPAKVVSSCQNRKIWGAGRWRRSGFRLCRQDIRSGGTQILARFLELVVPP